LASGASNTFNSSLFIGVNGALLADSGTRVGSNRTSRANSAFGGSSSGETTRRTVRAANSVLFVGTSRASQARGLSGESSVVTSSAGLALGSTDTAGEITIGTGKARLAFNTTFNIVVST